jgi:cardiolipin synthase
MQDIADIAAHARRDIIAVFTEGDDVYADMLWHIRRAQESIRLECYIFEDDAIGREFGEALAERARAGVDVRVHVDAIGSMALTRSDLPEVLGVAGVAVRWFNPWRWLRPLKFNRRNHRKLLVVDGATAWLGGFNIHEESSRRCFGAHCWRDTHVRIKGPLAGEAAEFFDRLWRGERRWRARVEPGRGAFLVSNHNFRQVHRFRHLLTRRMHRATWRVWLTTPYFMPDYRTQHEMARAARRGIDVRLLVPFKTDRVVTQWAARAAYAQLLSAGVRIYEYQPTFIHAKLLVADPEEMYDRENDRKLNRVREKLEAVESGEEPPIAPTFAELRRSLDE